MNIDLGCCLVVFLVWWQGIGPSYGRTARLRNGTGDTGPAGARHNSTSTGGDQPSPRDHHLPDNVQVGCKELRAKRYISDGFCTSIKPVKEVVCVGTCLPIRDLPWYSEFVKYWSRDKLDEWQCEDDIVKRKKVRLLCEDNSVRTYKIKVVKSCKCKKTVDDHNRTKRKDRKRRRRKQKRNRKSRKPKQNTNDNSNAP